MQIDQDIKTYLDEEGIVERTTEEISEELERENPGFTKVLDKVTEDYERREISSSQYYDILCKIHNGMPLYDHFKGRSRGGVEWILQQVKDLGIRENANVLDVCCGTGLEAVFLAGVANQGYVQGRDSSQCMIDNAKRRAERRGLRNVNFSVGDRDELDYKSQFDFLLCLHSLTEGDLFYGPDAEIGMHYVLGDRFERFRKALRKGGKVGISVPIFDPNVMGEDYVDYEKKRIFSSLGHTGFDPVDVSFFQFTNIDDVCLNYLFASATAD